MALFMNQNNERSELQKRIAAELSEKAKKRDEQEKHDRPDGVSDSNYLKDTKTTTSYLWLWMFVGGFIIVGTIVLMINLR